MRRAARVDQNQREIVGALRLAGASVAPLHQLGGGIPDLLVATAAGETLLIECKAGKGKLTPDQVLWHSGWKGRIEIVRDLETADALARGILTWQRLLTQGSRP